MIPLAGCHLRLVLDTNTAVSALLWRGPPHRLVVRSGRLSLTVVSSPVLLAELEEVAAQALQRLELAQPTERNRSGGIPDSIEQPDRVRKRASVRPLGVSLCP